MGSPPKQEWVFVISGQLLLLIVLPVFYAPRLHITTMMMMMMMMMMMTVVVVVVVVVIMLISLSLFSVCNGKCVCLFSFSAQLLRRWTAKGLHISLSLSIYICTYARIREMNAVVRFSACWAVI